MMWRWQYNRQFKVYEPLEFVFDVCETLLLWEQVCVCVCVICQELLNTAVLCRKGWKLVKVSDSVGLIYC